MNVFDGPIGVVDLEMLSRGIILEHMQMFLRGGEIVVCLSQAGFAVW